jgi:hypothetical protein
VQEEEAAEVLVVVPPPPAPPRSEATKLVDNLTVFLGTIYRDGHKKDQLDIRYKCWKALVHHREEVKAERVMEEMLTYMEPLQEQEDQEELVEEEEVQVVAAPEDSEEAPPTTGGATEEQSVNLLEDSGGEEKVDGEQEQGNFTAGEEEEEEDDDDGSETLVPPPPKPFLAPILPLYTNKPPFNKPLRGNRRPLHNKNLNKNILPQKRPAAQQTTPRPSEEDDINTQSLLDFSTQALMDAASIFTDQGLPPPRRPLTEHLLKLSC